MTTIRFIRARGRLSGFSCQGHSGWAQAGQDIVCAAVTSAIRLAECTINDILGAGAAVSICEDPAEITLALPAPCPNEDACRAVLEGLRLLMGELSKENPNHLTVLEV